MIANDILAGRYDIYGGGTKSGKLGTYVNLLWPEFVNRSRIIDNVESMLGQGWYTQNYIGKNLLMRLPEIATTAEDRDRMIAGLATAVKTDARIIVNRLSELPDDWVKEVQERVAAEP